MVEATSTELADLQREIERTRQDITEAFDDLNRAAHRMVSPEVWKENAREKYRQRPFLYLGVAFGAGAALAVLVTRPKRTL